MTELIGTLAAGKLDIVGDVHGEIEALDRLLGRLGYNEAGQHPDGRHLVFVGDLVDRGPDSPAVVECVQELVRKGRAQCVLGNHELNILRGVEKDGNAWFTNPEDAIEPPAKRVRHDQRSQIEAFIATLPVALERDDLRVVHACWHHESIATIRKENTTEASVLDIYNRYVQAMRDTSSAAEGLKKQEAQELAEYLVDRDWRQPVLLSGHAESDVHHQMGNPVRVLTSGVETHADSPFWAGGKWRMVKRVKWWEHYEEPTPVIVGHYWRRFSEAQKVLADKQGPDLFEGVEPHHWMGQRSNVYCVDFSVGGRAYARLDSDAPLVHGQLSALRVPEWIVVHDDDDAEWRIGEPGSRPTAYDCS